MIDGEQRIMGGLGLMLGAFWAWQAPGSWGPLIFGGAYALFGLWNLVSHSSR